MGTSDATMAPAGVCHAARGTSGFQLGVVGSVAGFIYVAAMLQEATSVAVEQPSML